MTAPASPPVAVGVDWLEVYAAVRPVLDRHPMIDSSTAHKLDIQAGWIVDALRALASPVSGDRSSADADTHRDPVPPVVGWQDISTAPRDGTNILAYDDGAVTVLFWDTDRADWFHPYKGGKTRWSDVTHWMPLPPEPDTVSTNEVRDE